MMRHEHFKEAERWLRYANEHQWTRECELAIMMAQVHATLAGSGVGA